MGAVELARKAPKYSSSGKMGGGTAGSTDKEHQQGNLYL